MCHEKVITSNIVKLLCDGNTKLENAKSWTRNNKKKIENIGKIKTKGNLRMS